MKKGFIKRMIHGQRGITGLETAIILIAFVVVASVFAYTVLSSGLFSTQKAQEAVYGGLSEAQSTLQLKGSVVANGVAQLNNCDYVSWVADTDVDMTRDATVKMEGSASLKAVVDAATSVGDPIVAHAMDNMNLADGDTLSFFLKTDNITTAHMNFVLSANADLTAPTQTYSITYTSANWTQHTITLAAGDDAAARYYGITVADDACAGTFYLDNVRFDAVEAFHGESIALSNCDYPLGWVAGNANMALARETTEVAEGLGSTTVTIGADAAAGDVVIVHAMDPKDWVAGDVITFWINAAAALDGNMTFHLNDSADLDDTPLVSYPIDTDGTATWQKFEISMAGTESAATHYGIVLTIDAEGAFYLDGITCPANHSDNNDPMLAYATDVVFTVGNALGGEPVDFTPTVDADQDGIISDETTKSHKVVISFSDSFTQVTDLAWTRTAVGTDDGDTLLEANEKFAVTVDLTYVNDNTGVLGAKQKINANHKFRIELKPHKGAVLTIERTLPIRVRNVMNLD